MPCYDKKLEASRHDFYNEAYSTRDVDCVITTGELERMMREKGWNLSIPVTGEDDLGIRTNGTGSSPSLSSLTLEECDQNLDTIIPELITHPGTSSGSYLHSLIVMLMGTSDDLELNVRNIRSADYEEYTLTHRLSREIVFRGAKCYGFRNLQNVVRKVGRDAGVQVGRGAAGRLGGLRGKGVRTRKNAGGDAAGTPEKGYDYVEVMACPGGCANGGGQIRPPVRSNVDEEGYKRDWESSGVAMDVDLPIQGQSAKWGDREWTKKVEEMYWHGLPTPPPSPTLDHGNLRIGTDAKRHFADLLALEVLKETCNPAVSIDDMVWTSSMNEEAEAKRRTLFRTQYRAVESEVVGLAVKW